MFRDTLLRFYQATITFFYKFSVLQTKSSVFQGDMQ